MIEKIKMGPKIPEMVTERLLDSIFKKTLKIGQELPSEKELCELLGVSRGSLRESLAIMEFLGIIENERKKRIVVRDQVRAEKVLSLIKISNKSELIYDFIELRKVLEPFSVELAIMRAKADELKELEMAIFELQEEKDARVIKANQRFHIGIAKATHNALLALTEELLMHILDSFRQRVWFSLERKKQVIEEHRNIYEAICKKDVSRARDCMLEHLGQVEKAIKDSSSIKR